MLSLEQALWAAPVERFREIVLNLPEEYKAVLPKMHNTYFSQLCVKKDIHLPVIRMLFEELPKAGITPPRPTIFERQWIEDADLALFRLIMKTKEVYEMIESGILDARDLPKLVQPTTVPRRV